MAEQEKFNPNKHIIHVNCERPISPEMEQALIHMCELAYNMPTKNNNATAQNKPLQSIKTL